MNRRSALQWTCRIAAMLLLLGSLTCFVDRLAGRERYRQKRSRFSWAFSRRSCDIEAIGGERRNSRSLFGPLAVESQGKNGQRSRKACGHCCKKSHLCVHPCNRTSRPARSTGGAEVSSPSSGALRRYRPTSSSCWQPSERQFTCRRICQKSRPTDRFEATQSAPQKSATGRQRYDRPDAFWAERGHKQPAARGGFRASPRMRSPSR